MSVGKSKRVKVAIIGGGPAGLGAAIELSRLPFVDWILFEKKPQISETGGGISLQLHTWALLDQNEVTQHIAEDSYFRHPEGLIEERRNGRNGKLLLTTSAPSDIPYKHRTCRLARAKLQAALLKSVDSTQVRVGKRLNRVEQLQNRRVRIHFDDESTDEVDLLISADGIRSIIRQTCFPGQELHYNGQCVYRTVISKTSAKQVKGIPWAPVFWKHKSGLYVYTCPLGDNDFEVTARIRRQKVGMGQVSWGRSFDLKSLLHKFTDFCKPVRDILELAAEGHTQEFALLTGPRTDSMIHGGNIVFVGDAAHALCGNFGAGAGFALEDVHTLAESLAWAYSSNRPIADALDLYNSIRSPHYKQLYEVLDDFAAIKDDLRSRNLPIDKDIETRVEKIAQASKTWMYYHDIEKTIKEAIEQVNKLAKRD